MTRVVRTDDARRLVPAAVVTASEEAKGLLSAAETQAKEILRAAEARAVALEQGARERGLESARAEAAGLLAQAALARNAILERSQEDIRTIAAVAAERMTGEALRLSPDLVNAAVRSALDLAKRGGPLAVAVHPADAPLLSGAALEVITTLGASIEHDPTLTRGGCVVRSTLGTVDARVETRIETVSAILGVRRP